MLVRASGEAERREESAAVGAAPESGRTFSIVL